MSTVLEYRAQQILARTPISKWLPYEAYDDKNKVYRLDDGRIGALWSSRPLLGLDESRIQKVLNLFESDMPAGTTYQFMMHASPVIEPMLDRHVVLAERGANDPQYIEDAKTTREFYLHARETSLIPNPPLKPRDFTVYISITIPVHDSNSGGWEEDRIYQALDGIEEQLRTMGLFPERVPPLEFVWLLHTLLNPGHSWESRPPAYSLDLPIRDQAVRLDTVAKTKVQMLELDGKYIKNLTVQAWPLQWSGNRNRDFIGSLTRLTDQIVCPFFITLNVLRMDQVKAKARIGKKHLVVTNQAKGVLLNLIPAFRAKLEHFNGMMQEIEGGRQIIGQFFQVALYGDTPRQAQQQADAMRSIYRAMDINLQDDYFVGFKVFLCGLPLGLPSDETFLRDNLRRLKTVHTAVPANCVPLVADWKGGGAPVLLNTSRSGQLMGLDMFANKQGNYNMAVIGTSGGGKSFAINWLLREYLSKGARAWMIDAGYSYVKLCEILKGQYIQYTAQGAKLCFNPFTKLVHWGGSVQSCDSDEVDRADELAVLLALHAQMASPSRKLTDPELAMLEGSLVKVLHEEGNQGTPTSVMRLLKEYKDDRAKDMALVLEKFSTGGAYGRLFNGVNNIDFENDFVVLEMDGLSDQKALGSVLLLSVMMNIQSVMYEPENRGRRKFMGMDEAWDLLSEGGNVSAFFEKGARRVRKYGGSILTITQGVEDYYVKMKDIGPALLGNADFVWLLKQKPESIKMMQDTGRIKLSDWEYNLLGTVDRGRGYSEIFQITPFGRGIVRLTVPRLTQLLYTTDPDELALIDRIRQQGGQQLSIKEAIELILEQERQQNGL